MNTGRRAFLKLGALFVPAVAAPTVAYSFLWAPKVKTILFGFDVRAHGRIIASGHFESGVAVVDRWEPRIDHALAASSALTLTAKYQGPLG